MKDSHDQLNEIIPGYKIASGDLERTVLYIYCKTNNYVIFELKETGQISYKTIPEFDDNTFKIALKLDKVEAYLGEDKTLWCEYKNTMADIYSLYLSNDHEKVVIAEELLDTVISEIDYNKYSKLYYLLPCLIAVIICCFLSISFRSYNMMAKDTWYTIDENYLTLLYMMTFGSIGGLLSIAINIDKHQDKISRIKWQRIFAGIFRMLVAMLSGLMIYILFRADLITVISAHSNNYMQYTLAILAGFSQNLIPNLANKGESMISGDKGGEKK